MKKVILLSLFTLHFSLFISFSQNLVPNPSFETHTTCTGNYGFNYLGTLPDIIPPWYSPSKGTPDYFNLCYTSASNKIPKNEFGYQYPRTGNAYAGILVFYQDNTILNYREYIQVQLTDTLITGNYYCINFYINYTPFLNSIVKRSYAVKEVGLYISDTAIVLPNQNGNYTSFPVVPQITSTIGVYLFDTLNWVEVSGNYTAHGGEKYITIGNFKDNANTDTLLTSTNYTVNGSVTTKVSYYYIEDVSVTNCTGQGVNELDEINNISIYPNPAASLFTISTASSKIKQIKIYNVLGEVVSSQQATSNSVTIDISNEAKGIYFVEVVTENGIIRKKLVKQ